MYEFLQYQVKDAMTPNPATVNPETPLRELQRIFEDHDFNGVPVLDDRGQLMGMATKFDVLKAFSLDTHTLAPHYGEIMAKPVRSVLSADPITVSPDLPLSRLLQKLVEMGIKSFPVVDEAGCLVGIIAREDVLQALRRATSDERPREELER